LPSKQTIINIINPIRIFFQTFLFSSNGNLNLFLFLLYSSFNKLNNFLFLKHLDIVKYPINIVGIIYKYIILKFFGKLKLLTILWTSFAKKLLKTMMVKIIPQPISNFFTECTSSNSSKIASLIS